MVRGDRTVTLPRVSHLHFPLGNLEPKFKLYDVYGTLTCCCSVVKIATSAIPLVSLGQYVNTIGFDFVAIAAQKTRVNVFPTPFSIV